MSSWHIPQVSEPTYVAGVVAGAGGGTALGAAFWAAPFGGRQSSDAKNRVRKAACACRFIRYPLASVLCVNLIHRVCRAGAVTHGATLAERRRVGEEM